MRVKSEVHAVKATSCTCMSVLGYIVMCSRMKVRIASMTVEFSKMHLQQIKRH